MGEKVSWQELMRIKCDNDFDDDDGSLSPVFHKNKWVVVRKPTNLKEPASSQSDDKSLSKKGEVHLQEGCKINSHEIDRASFSKQEKIKAPHNCSQNKKEVTEQLTPVRKSRPSKRKLINLIDCSLVGSGSQTNNQISKKTKTHDPPQNPDKFFSQPRNDVNKSKSGKTNLSECLIKSESQPVNCLQKKSLIDLNNIKRRLIYSINKKPSEKSVCPENLTINNFYKSVIMLEEADKIVSMNIAKKPEFNQFSEDFVTVTDLNNKISDLSEAENNYNQDRIFEGSCKTAADVSDDCPSPVRHNSLNDSFINFQFTEVEECFRRAKPIDISNNEAESVSDANLMERGTFMNKGVLDSTPLLDNGNEDCLKKEFDSSCINAHEAVNIPEKSCTSISDVVESKNCNKTMQKITANQLCNVLDCEEVGLFETKKNYEADSISKSSYNLPNDGDKNNQAGPSGISQSSKEKSLLGDSKVGSSKYEDFMKDSAVFYDVSSQDDIFEHKSSPVKNVPEAEADTSESNKTPLQLSNSIAVKRVRDNLKTLLTPKSGGSSVHESVRKSHSSMSISVLDNEKALPNIKLELPQIKLNAQLTSCDGSLPESDCNFIMPNLQTDKTELSSDMSDLAGPSSKVTLNRSSYSEFYASYSKDTEENTGEEEKQKIESLLQDVLDNKNSAIPIQAYLSEDFSYVPSTLVQFSTASGSVVRITQASLDKAKALMKDVLDGESEVLNEEETRDHNQECTVTLIEVPKENLLKAKALLNDTLDGISCTQVVKEGNTSINSNIKLPKTSVKNNLLASKVVDKVSQLGPVTTQENQSDLSFIKQDINMKNNSFNITSSQQQSTDPCSSKMGALLKCTRRDLPENNLEKEEDCVLDLESSISDDVFQNKIKVGDCNILEYGTSSCGKPNNESFKISADIIKNEDYPKLFNANNSKNQDFEKDVLSSGIVQPMATLPQPEKWSSTDSATSLIKEVRNSHHDQLDALPRNQMKQPDKKMCGLLNNIESKCNLRTKSESASFQNESGYDFIEFEKTTRDPGIKLVNPIVTEEHFKKANRRSVKYSESKPETDRASLSNLAGRSFEFSTAAGGSVSVSEESLRKVRSVINEDSLFEESEELSYNFSSIGDNTILMVKEDTGPVKFKDISLCSSKSSQKDVNLSEKNIKHVNSFDNKLLLSQNSSIFVSSQLSHTYEGKSTQSLNTDFKISEENKNGNNFLTNSSYVKDVFGNCNSLKLTNNKHDLVVRSEISTSFSSAKDEKDVSNVLLQNVREKRNDLMETDEEIAKSSDLLNSTVYKSHENFKSMDNIQNKLSKLKEKQQCSSLYIDDKIDQKIKNSSSQSSGDSPLDNKGTQQKKRKRLSLSTPKAHVHKQQSLQTSQLKDELNFSNMECESNLATATSDKNRQNEQCFSSSTDSRSKANVSEDCLKTDSLQLKDEIASGSTFLQDTVQLSKACLMQNHGAFFSTASGSKVGVSEESFKAVQLKFKDELNERNVQLQSNGQLSERHPIENPQASFSTASVSKMSVSEDSLRAVELNAGNAQLQESRELAGDRYPNKNQGISFSTASGSKISVSEDSLKAVKLKFKDELDAGNAQLGVLPEGRYPNKNEGVSFSTASGSKVSVSEDSLEAVKLKFKDELDVRNVQLQNNEQLTEINPIKNQQASFSTALGSKVRVSEESLRAVKLKFQDELDAGNPQLGELPQERYPNKNPGVSFSTASGSKVSVSEDSLKAVKLKFKDELDAGNAQLQDNGQLSERNPIKNQQASFSIASGSKVRVSEESLRAVKLKFQDELDAGNPQLGELPQERYPNKNPGVSFSTASGSKVSVSEDSLKAVKLKFKDELDAGNAQLQDNGQLSERNPIKNQQASFSIASGSKVRVSEESLRAVKLKFQDELDAGNAHLRELPEERYPNKNLRVSFSTASGSKVSVSEDSLKAVKQRFKDELDAGTAQLQDNGQLSEINPIKNQQASFSTASGSKVSVSEDSLKAVKQRFKDELDAGTTQLQDNGQLSEINPIKNQQASFSTASGSKVSVSEDTLKAVKLKFMDELDAGNAQLQGNRQLPEIHPIKNQQASFSTASGSKVNVSEDSLKAVKRKFKDELDAGNAQLHESRELAGGGYPNKNQGISFSTASGSKVSVSEDSLKAVKRKFKDELDAGNAQLQESRELAGGRYPNKNQGISFSTASGSKVSVSEDSLKAVKMKFKDELDAGNAQLQESSELAGGRFPNQNKGISFSTASGSKVSVSEESLKAVKLKFKDELDAGNAQLQESRELAGGRFPNQNKGISFSTASGSKVSVSEESLKAVKLKFKDELDAGSAQLQESRELAGGRFPNQNKGISFSTASGSNVSVSEESLKAVKLKFKDELDAGNAQLQESQELTAIPSENDFLAQQDCYLSLSVHNSNLEQSSNNFENLLENILVANTSNMKNKKTLNQHGFTFSTAQGERIGVSEESLKKVKRQFKEELPCDIITPEKLNSSFPTAKGSTVNPSEESSQNIRLEFEEEFDINKVQQQFVNFSNQHNLKEREFSFSTAQGTKIVVSEDSLQKVRLQFKDEFDIKELQSENISLSKSIDQNSPSSAQRNDLKGYDTDDMFQLYMMDTQFDGPTDVQNAGTLKPKEATPSKDAHSSFSSDPNSPVHPSQFENKSDLFMHFTQSIGGPLLNEELNRLENHISKTSESKCFESSSNFVTTDQTRFPRQQSVSVNERDSSNKIKLETLNKRAIGGTQMFVKPSDKKLFNFLQVNNSTSNQPVVENITKENIHDYSNSDKNVSVESISVDLSDLKSRVSAATKTDKLSEACLLSVTQEVSDSAAALIDDSEGFGGRPFVTTPSSAFNRNYLKPITAWSLELDNDDDILAAAETPKKAGSFMSNSSEVTVSVSPISEKRKSGAESPLESENKKIKLSDDQIDNKGVTEEILTMREKRREEHKFKINLKKQNSPSISAGLYMSIRSRQALSTFMDSPLNNPQLFSYEELLEMGLHKDVINVTAKNAVDFKFTAHQYFSLEECFSKDGQINLGNGFMVVLSDNNEIGLEEISASFLCHPNVDPSLLHQDWIKNHYRWIIWKLASLDKSFPKIASGRFLIPVNVLHQLKYRYDREIDLAQRPALRKILECDAPPSRRFIACVADIRKIESEELESKVEIELTDGWYSVWTTIDTAMEDLINKKKIKIGTKLIIHGAELMNCSDGCDPLELNNSIRLKLHTNSVRRVKWFAKMGFTRYPGPLGISLDSILPNGGLVGLTTAVVARVYPLLYMSKDSNEKTVIRNSYTENQIAAVNEKQRHLKSEELYENILAEVEGKYKKGSSVKYDLKKIKQITNPEVLWRIVSSESDPSEVHSLLSTDQLQALQKYHDEISSKIREEVNKILQEKLEELVPARKVTSLLKVRLADPLTECSAIVTIWRPSEDVCSLLSENRYLDLYALNSCGTRDKVLQLANTKHSRYKESILFSQTNKFNRKVTDISDLVFHSSFPVFGELDVVGIVVFVKEPDKPWGVTNVYLSDTKNNFLMITFWTSLKVFGFEEILREGSVVAAVNLHWRQGCGSYVVPSTFANEVTYFSTNPSQEYLSQEIQAAKRFLSDKGGANYVESRKDVLLSLMKDRSCQLPKPLTPLRQKENAISNKIERLKSYGPASPLPKVPLLSSPDIHKRFRSPKTCKTTPKSSYL